MATATMGYSGPGDGSTVDLTHKGTISDELMPYFFAYYRTVYGQVKVDPGNESEKPDNYRDMTDAETFERYASGIADGTAANVQRYVEEQLMAAARAQAAKIAVVKQA